MRYPFTQISEYIPYPKHLQAKLTTIHCEIIDYAIHHYRDEMSFRRMILDAMNAATYAELDNRSYSIDYESSEPFKELFVVCKGVNFNELNDLEIISKNIIWDISEFSDVSETSKSVKTETTAPVVKPTKALPTDKADLHLIKKYPTYDGSKIVMQKDNVNGTTMFKSLPEIPKCQNDISITTDVNAMSYKDLMNLYPNRVIQTRKPIFYETFGDMDYDEILGVIYPISGFTKQEIVDNIIKYPHIHKPMRMVDNELVSFYKHIEIDGELVPISEAWPTLLDSKLIPNHPDYIREYLIRKYLLERDAGIEHKYPLFGELQPYITLFMPYSYYEQHGCKDAKELARQCVENRIKFLTSRNPMIRSHYSVSMCPMANNCIENFCDYSCPIHAEMSYLFERNEIKLDSNVFKISKEVLKYANQLFETHSEEFCTIISDNTIETASQLVYTAICNKWKGNGLHCAVYHLKLSNYLSRLQQSWGLSSTPEELEYEQIFINSAKILIISNIDFIKFSDFQAQTLLNIIHTRLSDSLPTYVVSPKPNQLIGDGQFFDILKRKLKEGVVE